VAMCEQYLLGVWWLRGAGLLGYILQTKRESENVH